MSFSKETNRKIHESKRTKPLDENDVEDEEPSQFLDRRCTTQISSQNNKTQTTTNHEQRKSTARKPTARKLSTNQSKPTMYVFFLSKYIFS